MRKEAQERCEHCGKWTRECGRYTLFGAANGHYHEEDVAICKICADDESYDENYWYLWLEHRFGTRDN
jgi:hypothetical protein